jgi:hypothetical protein
MDKFDKETLNSIKPFPGEINEAKHNPNGWVYRIAGNFLPHEDVPPEAIVGAWKVNNNGEIIGEFKINPNYDPKLYPSKS